MSDKDEKAQEQENLEGTEEQAAETPEVEGHLRLGPERYLGPDKYSGPEIARN